MVSTKLKLLRMMVRVGGTGGDRSTQKKKKYLKMNGQPDGLGNIGFRRFGVELDFCVLSGEVVKFCFSHHHHEQS